MGIKMRTKLSKKFRDKAAKEIKEIVDGDVFDYEFEIPISMKVNFGITWLDGYEPEICIIKIEENKDQIIKQIELYFEGTLNDYVDRIYEITNKLGDECKKVGIERDDDINKELAKLIKTYKIKDPSWAKD